MRSQDATKQLKPLNGEHLGCSFPKGLWLGLRWAESSQPPWSFCFYLVMFINKNKRRFFNSFSIAVEF